MKRFFLKISVLLLILSLFGMTQTVVNINYATKLDTNFNPFTTNYTLYTNVGGSQVDNNQNSILFNFTSSLYIYGYSTSGICPASPLQNGSVVVGKGLNGYNDTGLAITTSPGNSYSPTYNSHYTIGGIGVDNFLNYKTFYKVNVPPIESVTTVNLSFNVTSYSLVVFAGMSGGAYSIQFSGITNLHIASILNSPGSVGLEFAYANLTSGQYTITEKITNGDGGSNTRSEIVSAIVFTSTNAPTTNNLFSGVTNAELYGMIGLTVTVAVIGGLLVLMRRKS